MKYLVAFLLLGFIANLSKGEECYKDTKRFCGSISDIITNCNSTYSGVNVVQSNLQQYAATHIEQNFNYLLMSAYFNNYDANREGFSKLYRKLADDAWEDALDLVKYMAKRGFNMNYEFLRKEEAAKISYKMSELESLAVALDLQKVLAEQAHKIHREIRGHHNKHQDAETINFLETEFVSKHASVIRDLAGHVNDLLQLIKDNDDPSLAIYLFDEHLKKIVE